MHFHSFTLAFKGEGFLFQSVNVDKLLKEIKTLSNYQLEMLIKKVSDLRISRKPEISIDFQVVNATEPIVNPEYRVSLDQFTGTTFITFRHPGIGWLNFKFKSRERDRLMKIISHYQKNSGDTRKHISVKSK